jgi:REP element-mobilizing transposase RayT
MQGSNTLLGRASVAPTLWHLCWQAAVGREFFVHPSLHARIRERLIQAHSRRGRVLVDYVLLPTEIHVLAQLPPGESASDVARAIGNVVSRWVRQAQPVRSPVLAGPHLAHRIASMAELRSDVRMLAWRPVQLGVCHTPSHHPHGALRIALGLTPVQGFDSRWLLQMFGDTVPQARAALRAWVSRRPNERAWREWELTRGLALAMGSVGPQPNMAMEVRGAGGAALVAAGRDGIDGALGLLEIWVALKLGLRAAAELRDGAGSASARGRALVACLAVRHQLCSAASVARYYGRAKATLSEQMTACKARRGDRPILATPARRIVDEAHALASSGLKACPEHHPRT